ncbi:ArsR family transcriptional regulator [bacterium 336/3]|nr:ArsR family transcriptional regulator [bacterium 336/3]
MEIIEFSQERLEKVANILKAIAHPIRIQIVNLLHINTRMNVSELLEIIHIDQGLLSHHLINMKDKGILACEREGKNIYYSLKETAIVGVLECMKKCKI